MNLKCFKFKGNRSTLKIPKRYKLFGTTYTVTWDDRLCNELKSYGICDYSASEITMSETEGGRELSADKMMDTWYHERTHSILDMMGEHKLSCNEKFVDVFSKLQRQADESAEF